MPHLRDSIAAAWRNPTSQLGFAVALVCGTLIAVLIAVELLGLIANPYVGIITYLILPTLLAAGVVLIVWGLLRERKRSGDGRFPVIDLNLRRTRRRLTGFLAMLAICVVVLATATSGGIHYMESNAFCGTVCHTIMSPEYTAFQDSPHAALQCVDCHVKPGTGGFIKAKFNGMVQLVSAVTGGYDRPIPTPVHGLPPTDVTCRECHWEDKFHGVKPKMITRFAEDEASTETKTILLMNVGGSRFGESLGIHWHTDPDVRIRYRADESRRNIHEVELTLPDGTVKRYTSPAADEAAHAKWRTMECIDCHNRPAHVFASSATAVDLALERGLIDRDLPYVRREAVRAIEGDYDSHAAARRGISETIAGFYAGAYPEVAAERRASIEEAGRVLGDIYARNVFPEMMIDWGTYPSLNGHDNGATGCFRCHAGDHRTETGEMISVDCRVCHTIAAWDEATPQLLEILQGARRENGKTDP